MTQLHGCSKNIVELSIFLILSKLLKFIKSIEVSYQIIAFHLKLIKFSSIHASKRSIRQSGDSPMQWEAVAGGGVSGVSGVVGIRTVGRRKLTCTSFLDIARVRVVGL